MGRKSLARERQEQILHAFEECILERGFDAASIGAVAERAGGDRTRVHHSFGNRDALVSALLERVVDAYKRNRDEVVALIPPDDRKRALLDHVFSAGFNPPRLARLFDELYTAALHSPTIQAAMLGVYREFEEMVVAELEKACPDAPARRRREVAFSILCLTESCADLIDLGFPASRRRAARAAADALLSSLETPS